MFFKEEANLTFFFAKIILMEDPCSSPRPKALTRNQTCLKTNIHKLVSTNSPRKFCLLYQHVDILKPAIDLACMFIQLPNNQCQPQASESFRMAGPNICSALFPSNAFRSWGLAFESRCCRSSWWCERIFLSESTTRGSAVPWPCIAASPAKREGGDMKSL